METRRSTPKDLKLAFRESYRDLGSLCLCQIKAERCRARACPLTPSSGLILRSGSSRTKTTLSNTFYITPGRMIDEFARLMTGPDEISRLPSLRGNVLRNPQPIRKSQREVELDYWCNG